jgi:hypothetical protein
VKSKEEACSLRLPNNKVTQAVGRCRDSHDRGITLFKAKKSKGLPRRYKYAYKPSIKGKGGTGKNKEF